MSQQSESSVQGTWKLITPNRVTFYNTTTTPDGRVTLSHPRSYNTRLVTTPPHEITEAQLQDFHLTPVHPSAIWAASLDKPIPTIAGRTRSARRVQFADATTSTNPQTSNTEIQEPSQRPAEEPTSIIEIIPLDWRPLTSAMSKSSSIASQEQHQQTAEQQTISTNIYPLLLDGGCNFPVSEKHLAKASSKSSDNRTTAQKAMEHTISGLGYAKRVISQGWTCVKGGYWNARRCLKGGCIGSQSPHNPGPSLRSDHTELDEVRETNREQRDNMFVYTETGKPMGL